MKKYLSVALTLLVFEAWSQQDPQYNMYQFNMMVVNPAYAGSRDAIAIVNDVRQQWVAFPGAPQTICLSAHAPIAGKNIGVGGTIINDAMGPRNVISAYGNFAYILKITNKMRLSFGINGGYNRYQFKFSSLNFNQAEVPSQLLSTQNLGTMDVNTGLFFKMSTFFAGLSATHLNSPNVYSYKDQGGGKYSYKIHTHLFLTLGKSFIINKDMVFAPTILVKGVGSNYTVDANFNFFLFKKMWMGAFYRAGFGPGALFQYYISNNFRAGLSYDSGVSDAFKLGGSYEVMLGYDFDISKNRVSKNINPRFL